MKRLYARLVLWLIRPALDLRAEQRLQIVVAAVDRASPELRRTGAHIRAITEFIGGDRSERLH